MLSDVILSLGIDGKKPGLYSYNPEGLHDS